MDFKVSADKLFETLGEEVKIKVGENVSEIKALIQPMRYKNKLYLEAERTELGFKDSECFLYLGPGELDFAGKEQTTVVATADRCFNVSRADRITLKGVTQYIWAILTPRTKDGDYDAL